VIEIEVRAPLVLWNKPPLVPVTGTASESGDGKTKVERRTKSELGPLKKRLFPILSL
jgi:hypothetical protein